MRIGVIDRFRCLVNEGISRPHRSGLTVGKSPYTIPTHRPHVVHIEGDRDTRVTVAEDSGPNINQVNVATVVAIPEHIKFAIFNMLKMILSELLNSTNKLLLINSEAKK